MSQIEMDSVPGRQMYLHEASDVHGCSHGQHESYANTQEPLSFLHLPREVRDLIHGFAYRPQGVCDFKVLTKRAWKAEEKHRRSNLKQKFVVSVPCSGCA